MMDHNFWDHRDRLALYGMLVQSGKVKDRSKLYERLVLKPTQRLAMKQKTAAISRKLVSEEGFQLGRRIESPLKYPGHTCELRPI